MIAFDTDTFELAPVGPRPAGQLPRPQLHRDRQHGDRPVRARSRSPAPGVHTDSAEELLIILQGTAEARIGDEIGRLEKNQVGLVPPMAPTACAISATTCSACSGRSRPRPSCPRSSMPFEEDGPQVLVIGSPIMLAGRLEEPVAA